MSEETLIEELVNMSNNILVMKCEEDTWIWRHESSGLYTVHSAYLAISEMKEASQDCPI